MLDAALAVDQRGVELGADAHLDLTKVEVGAAVLFRAGGHLHKALIVRPLRRSHVEGTGRHGAADHVEVAAVAVAVAQEGLRCARIRINAHDVPRVVGCASQPARSRAMPRTELQDGVRGAHEGVHLY